MNKRISLNLFGQLVSFLCSLGISFFVTPFVVSNLGTEVYGFVNLATNFTSYITLFTTAITSMLARYVTIEYSKRNYKSASEFFSTAVLTLLVLSAILVIPVALFTGNMEHFITISPQFVPDVKILWALVFAGFLFSLPMSCYNVGAFASNRLDLSAVVTTLSSIMRAGVLFCTFLLFPPKVWYIGIATILAELVTICGHFILKRKQIPEVTLSVRYFKRKSIHELVVVGIWNSISRLSQILNTGLDLILTNLFINGNEMGLLSVAKTIPAQLGNLSGSVYNAFEPSMTIVYTEDNKAHFIGVTSYAMRSNGFLCSIPMIGFICFGKSFYSIWIPSLSAAEIDKIYLLALLTMLPQVLEIYVQPLYAVNTITKKLRTPVIVNVGSGILNILIVFLLLNTTTLGVYAVAGVSSILSVIRICTFIPMYAARCIDDKWSTFYGPLVRGCLNTVCLAVLFGSIVSLIEITGWVQLILTALVCVAVGYFFSFFIMFGQNDRKKVINAVKKWTVKVLHRK